jgi:hypothetical protein
MITRATLSVSADGTALPTTSEYMRGSRYGLAL